MAALRINSKLFPKTLYVWIPFNNYLWRFIPHSQHLLYLTVVPTTVMHLQHPPTFQFNICYISSFYLLKVSHFFFFLSLCLLFVSHQDISSRNKNDVCLFHCYFLAVCSASFNNNAYGTHILNDILMSS